MRVCCKRCIAFILFFICIIISAGSAAILAESDTSENKLYMAVCYGIIILTCIRYRQFINDCQRYCSGFLIVVCYLVLWFFILSYYTEEKALNAIIAFAASLVSFCCDMWVFSSKAYTSNDRFYEVLPAPEA